MKDFTRTARFDNTIEVSGEWDGDEEISVGVVNTHSHIEALVWLNRGQLKALYRHIGKLLIG